MKALFIPFIISWFFFFQLNTSNNLRKDKINKRSIPYEKMYLQTDKPLYKPGDKVWFKIDIRKGDINLTYPLFHTCYVELLNPKGETIETKELELYQGWVNDVFTLPQNASGGRYSIQLTSVFNEFLENDWHFARKILVQKHVKPVLFLTLEFGRKSYSAGDTVIATLCGKNLSNKALSKATYTAMVFNGQQKAQFLNGELNHKGQAAIDFPIPEGTINQQVSMSVIVKNMGVQQNITKIVPITTKIIDVQFFPEGGTLMPKIKNTVAFKATMKNEKAVSIEGSIKNGNGKTVAQIKSYHNGMGKFDFIPEPSCSYFLHLTKPAGQTCIIKLPEIDNTKYKLQIEEHNEDFISLQFGGPENQTNYIHAYMADSMIFEEKLLLKTVTGTLKIPVNHLPAGIINIVLSDKNCIKHCERLVFINKKKLMRINVEPDKEYYLPREKVELKITTQNYYGEPVPANLSLRVINKKVLLSADDKQDNIVSWFLMGSELQGKIEEPAFYFRPEEPKADTALDLIMMTHGWKRYDWNPDINIDTLMGMTGEIRFEGRLTEKLPLKTLNDITIKIFGTDYCVKPDRNGRFVIKDLPFDANYYVEAVDSNNKRYKLSFTKEYKRPKSDFIIEEYSVDDIDVEEENEIIPALYEETGEDFDGLEYDITREEIMPDITNLLTIVKDDVDIYEEYEVEDLSIDLSELVEYDEVLEDEVFFFAEEMPEFPGGTDSLIRYISTNTQYPALAKRMCIEGKVYIRFVVRKDGRVDKVSVARGVDPLLDHEARRVVQNLPRWKPGKLRGKTVDVWYTVPILFILEGKTNIDSADYFEYIPQLRIQTQKFFSPQYSDNESQIKHETDFRETLFWQASVQTNKEGKAKVCFYTSDEITSFAAQAEGISQSGIPGCGSFEFASQPLIGMTIQTPEQIISGDKVLTPVIITNNTGERKAGELICILKQNQKINEQKFNIQLLPQSQEVIYPGITSTKNCSHIIAQYNFSCGNTILNKNNVIEVLPNGFHIEKSFSSTQPDSDISISINESIEGTLSSHFKCYLNMYAELEEGISSIIREPHGCFEQTSSSTYPNILALQLLQRQKSRNTKIQDRAYELIENGYDRLISFECTHGGFDLFGQDPPSPWLSAYGLLEFTEMQKVYPFVDTAMLTRTKNYLMSLRQGNGQFNIQTYNKAVTHVYLCYALSLAGITNIREELKFASDYALKSEDVYQMALASLAYQAIGDISLGKMLAERVMGQIHKNGWGNLKAKTSITSSGGQSLKAETAALALSCLMKYDFKKRSMLSNGAEYLMGHRKFGGFGTTQATILALKALTDFTLRNSNTAAPELLRLSFNNQIFYNKIEAGTNLFTVSLEEYFINGQNEVNINFPTESSAPPYSIDLSYKTYTPPDSKNCKFSLNSSLSDSIIEESQNVKLIFILRNKSQDTLPMPIVKIGIPCGLQLQSHLIEEVTEKQDVAFFELHNNFAVFYFRTLKPHEQKTIYLDLTTMFPGNFTGQASEAYLYYHPEQKSYNKGLHVSIKKGKDM